MAAESWVLDGLTLTSGTFAMHELTADPPAERPDWINAADSESAALMRQPLHDNRTITMKVSVAQQTTMDLALAQVAVLVDKLRKSSKTPDGIPLVWTPSGGTISRTFDVLDGEIKEMPIGTDGQSYGWFIRRPFCTIELICKPYWRGTETLTSTASSATPIVTLEVANVTGDVPALGRLIVTDPATQVRRHVEWGLENRYYDSGSPQSLLIDSDNMVTSGFAGAQTITTGAYDPNASGNNSVSASIPPSVTTAIAGLGDLLHQGVFRVKARVQVSTATTAAVRLAWQANDAPQLTGNWGTTIGQGRWEELDLGLITIPAPLTGSARWTGHIEAKTDTSIAATVIIDYLLLVPAGEGYGKARGIPSSSGVVVVGYDDFTSTTAGNPLNARVAPAGGTWTTSGVATDFAFADNFGGEQIYRGTVSEASPRFAILGATNYTDTQVTGSVYISAMPTGNVAHMGIIARWTDSSNYLRLKLILGNGGFSSQLSLEKVVAGVVTSLGATNVPFLAASVYVLRLTAYASGRVFGHAFNGYTGAIVTGVENIDPVLATAGTLANGKPGVQDQNFSAIAATRLYDGFAVATPPTEPVVIFSGRTCQFRHDDTIRSDSAGTYYGRPSSYRGTRFLVPPGTSRVAVKARRADVETSEDANVTDNTTIQVGWTPRGLAVPR